MIRKKVKTKEDLYTQLFYEGNVGSRIIASSLRRIASDMSGPEAREIARLADRLDRKTRLSANAFRALRGISSVETLSVSAGDVASEIRSIAS